MKVLIVSLSEFKGGGEQYIIKMAHMLQSEGVGVHIVAAHTLLIEELVQMGCVVTKARQEKNPIGKLVAGIRSVRKLCQTERFDYVVLNGQNEARLAFFIWGNFKKIIVRHNNREKC